MTHNDPQNLTQVVAIVFGFLDAKLMSRCIYMDTTVIQSPVAQNMCFVLRVSEGLCLCWVSVSQGFHGVLHLKKYVFFHWFYVVFWCFNGFLSLFFKNENCFFQRWRKARSFDVRFYLWPYSKAFIKKGFVLDIKVLLLGTILRLTYPYFFKKKILGRASSEDSVILCCPFFSQSLVARMINSPLAKRLGKHTQTPWAKRKTLKNRRFLGKQLFPFSRLPLFLSSRPLKPKSFF